MYISVDRFRVLGSVLGTLSKIPIWVHAHVIHMEAESMCIGLLDLKLSTWIAYWSCHRRPITLPSAIPIFLLHPSASQPLLTA